MRHRGLYMESDSEEDFQEAPGTELSRVRKTEGLKERFQR